MAESQQSRRGFLAIATMAIGGVIGAVMAIPLLRYLFYPVGRRVVSSAGEPIAVLDEKALAPGGQPVRVQVVASNIRNAWAVADNVPLGSAWLRKKENGEIEALSAVCPHLGCAIDFDQNASTYKCPCHKSAFAMDGSKMSGPAKRGLDPLPTTVDGGKIKITWIRYRADVPERERV